MAWNQPGFCTGALKADASMASNQHHIVKADTTNNQFTLCDTDGERGLGILQDTPGSGEAGDIMLMGISKVVVGTGETLVAGQHYGVDANGEAKTIEATVTGADVGDHVLGVVLEGAAAGELATVTIGLNTYTVEAQ
jgi:hypothetical protein